MRARATDVTTLGNDFPPNALAAPSGRPAMVSSSMRLIVSLATFRQFAFTPSRLQN